MATYLGVAEARKLSGLRLVLSEGVPGPWGEAAKAVLDVKCIPYTKVGQSTGVADGELFQWTGRDNAPVAVYEDERAVDGWSGILHLAERIEPEPSLLPPDPGDRVLMFGLAHEICSEDGLGWSRRLMIIHEALANPETPDAWREPMETLGAKYGYSESAGRAAPGRVREILELLSEQQRRQRAAGQRYLVGSALSALDLYWACFAELIEPLPEELAPLDPSLRHGYTLRDPDPRKALSDELLEHRDFIYRAHLELPLDY